MSLLREKWAEFGLQIGGAVIFVVAAWAGGIQFVAGLLLLLAVSVPLCYLAGVYVVSPPRPLRTWLARAAVADAPILVAAVALFGPRRAAVLAGALAAYQVAARILVIALRHREPRVVVVGNGELPEAVERALERRSGAFTRAANVQELDAAARDARGSGRLTVVLPRDPAEDPGIRQVLDRANAARVRVQDCATFLELLEGAVPAASVHDRWLDERGGFLLLRTWWAPALKRAADVAVATAALLVSSPLLVLCAIVVKATSPGPVFFVQERVGRGGRPFRILKFRTMVVHDPGSHSRYPAERDPRITPVGGLLRRTHLDEVPQLVNILRGDMSLIGPRAEWSVLVADYRARIPGYDLRHTVRPGVTGWAQVRYRYGFSSDDAAEKLRYDLFYVRRYSPFLDLVILARTVKTVLFGWAAEASF